MYTLQPVRHKLVSKNGQPTNEKETRLNAILAHYKHEAKRSIPNLYLRRNMLSVQHMNNYKNEVDRLTGELHDKPKLSALDRNNIKLRLDVLKATMDDNKIPMIGTKASYKYTK
jgi:hypothetical protein